MTYPVFVTMYNATLVTTIRVSQQAVDDYLALGWVLADSSGGTNTGPTYLTEADTDLLYERLISRASATAGQVPVLQADGTLLFGPPSAGVGTEDVQDIVGAMLRAGTGIASVPYDDTAGTATVNAAASLTVIAVTGNYTLATGDEQFKVLRSTAGSGVTITMPQDSVATIAQHAAIEWRQIGAGAMTFAAGTGATRLSRGSVFTSAGPGAVGNLIKDAANSWLVVGDLI